MLGNRRGQFATSSRGFECEGTARVISERKKTGCFFSNRVGPDGAAAWTPTRERANPLGRATTLQVEAPTLKVGNNSGKAAFSSMQ